MARVAAAAAATAVTPAAPGGDNPLSGFGKKIGDAWSNTTGAVGDVFKNVLSPRNGPDDGAKNEKRNSFLHSLPFVKGPENAPAPAGAEPDTPRDGPVPVVAAAPGETPLIEGFLVKKASRFPFNWLKRYCVFYASSKSLSYYVTQEEATKRTNIKGQRAVIVGIERLTTEEFGITFNVAEGKPLHARCGSADEQQRWLEALSAHFGVPVPPAPTATM